MRQFEMVYGVMMKDFGKPQFQTISMTFGDICGTWVADMTTQCVMITIKTTQTN